MMRDDTLKNSAGSLSLLSSLEEIKTDEVVPINCLPLEYILGRTGIPVRRVITIQGPTESTKSSKFWVLARFFLAHGGFGGYFDIESKHDPRLAQAYLGNPMAGYTIPPFGRMAVFRCGGPEQFGPMLMDFSNKMVRHYKETGDLRPLIIGIDTLGTSVSTKFTEEQRLKGKTDPGFVFAKTAASVQATLMGWIEKYMPQMPVTLVCMQQERKEMETGYVKATGGTFANYSKSIGIRMRRTGYWKKLDEAYPVITVNQEKMSLNTKRTVALKLPTTCVRNEFGFVEYSYDWGYAMLQMLSDMPATMIDDMMSVTSPSEMAFSVDVPAKAKRANDLALKYKGAGQKHHELGANMLRDVALCEELRDRLRITRCPVVETPYEVPDLLSGRMWLSPDEKPDDWDEKMSTVDKDGTVVPAPPFPDSLTQDQICQIHQNHMLDLMKRNKALELTSSVKKKKKKKEKEMVK